MFCNEDCVVVCCDWLLLSEKSTHPGYLKLMVVAEVCNEKRLLQLTVFVSKCAGNVVFFKL